MLGGVGFGWWLKQSPETVDKILDLAARAISELGRRLSDARDWRRRPKVPLRQLLPPAYPPSPPPPPPLPPPPPEEDTARDGPDASSVPGSSEDGLFPEPSDEDTADADANFDENFDEPGLGARWAATAGITGGSEAGPDCPSFARLPDSALIVIFALLPVDDRLRCESVCTGWRALARRPAVWQHVDVAGMRAAPRLLARHVIRLVQRASGITREGEPTHLLRSLVMPRRAEALTQSFLQDVLRHSVRRGREAALSCGHLFV